VKTNCAALIVCLSVLAGAHALRADVLNRKDQSDEISNNENITMKHKMSQPSAPKTSLVSLGDHSKLTALPSERNQIRKFNREVLQCEQTGESDKADFFRIGDTFSLGVVYDNSALSLEDRMKSIWLELRTAHPDELKQQILNFGIKEINYWDKDHFYFQAPGGQVFRLASNSTDRSKQSR